MQVSIRSTNLRLAIPGSLAAFQATQWAQRRFPLPMAPRCLLPGCLAAAAVLQFAALRPAASASNALWTLQSALQTCVETSQAGPCRAAEARVIALRRDPAYARASHLCREEIGELAQTVALLPRRDAVPNEVMASVADVQQACLPYGF